ncbi:hypothetical protein NLJ89_g10629 [Agrocybe chaxingu]|uniref:Uncharacterized protein n=1 Tax=Agrocybe chaxingu TaxID=84603 RepID=A0A9W8JYB2_9AGAR|nr:hypothetical protein NLJ89_g10629 [Agrocybe chaxingu]
MLFLRFLHTMVLLFLVHETTSAPISIKYVDPRISLRPHLKSILEGVKEEANDQIAKMQHVLRFPLNVDHKKILTTAFGPKYNLEEIRKNVNTVHHGILIAQDLFRRMPKPNTLARTMISEYDDSDRWVQFSTKFYAHTMTVRQQAGTLIHEASHQLFRAVDKWTREGKPRPMTTTEAKNATRFYCGYYHADFEHLKATVSEKMDRNADSYKIFGHLAKYGFDVSYANDFPHEWLEPPIVSVQKPRTIPRPLGPRVRDRGPKTTNKAIGKPLSGRPSQKS